VESRFSVQLSKESLKYIKKQNPPLHTRINNAIMEISKDPYGTDTTRIVKMKGQVNDVYRYRLGGVRIIYKIIKDDLVLLISEIGNRGDVYK
jgi:mRNA interferase RelE/StbE